MNNERREHIIKILDRKKKIQLSSLSKVFPEVSIMTLRRDLIHLEKEGYLIRTHGGAVKKTGFLNTQGQEDAYSMRAKENIEAKMVIAKKALSLVEKGRSMYFDAGSTIMCLADMLKDEGYTIITSAVNTALKLIKKPKISVLALGGTVNQNTLSCSGPNAESVIGSVNIDLAFMSASAFSKERGFTVSNLYESELKKKVIKKANKVIMLMDSSKIGKDLAFTYVDFENIDIWVCEKELPYDIKKEASEGNTKIM